MNSRVEQVAHRQDTVDVLRTMGLAQTFTLVVDPSIAVGLQNKTEILDACNFVFRVHPDMFDQPTLVADRRMFVDSLVQIENVFGE